MWPIIFCSIVALTITIERLIYFRRAKINTQKFMANIASILRQNRVVEAINVCDETPGPIARILKAGILKHDRAKPEIKEAIEDEAAHEIPHLEKYINFLATIAQISPLLGLLGTVTGMVRCFQVVQEKATTYNTVSPGDLAGGIWEALLTTVAGLIVAIPAFVAYNYFVSRANDFVSDMERSATELVNVLTQDREKF
jgi:biopolymer transport protein ExbB